MMGISVSDFTRGYQTFQAHEPRDAMYKIATFVVSQFWGNPKDMADGLGVLLLTWNQAFYRYGPFDFGCLESAIRANLPTLKSFKNRDILTLEGVDESAITDLFGRFLDALRITEGKQKGRRSPVAAAKALHLLGPSFFPLWDDKIARAYDCYYDSKPAEKYVAFSYKIWGRVLYLVLGRFKGIFHVTHSIASERCLSPGSHKSPVEYGPRLHRATLLVAFWRSTAYPE